MSEQEIVDSEFFYDEDDGIIYTNIVEYYSDGGVEHRLISTEDTKGQE